MKKLIMVCMMVMTMVSLAQETELTSVMGVHVGMSMQETLDALQARSKRFHALPQVDVDDDTLGLLTNLKIGSVRLGWDNNCEMIARVVEYSFFHGKVVRIVIFGKDDLPSSAWDKFLRKIPAAGGGYDVEKMGSEDGVLVNDIEHCKLKYYDRTLILRDKDLWNSYIAELNALKSFFDSVPRSDEVMD